MGATNDGGSEWQPQRGERHRPPVQRTGASLERQALEGRAWTTSETFDDGPALFAAVCKLGLEGVVAKNATSRYRPNERGWVKIKNDDPEARASGANSRLELSGQNGTNSPAPSRQ